MNKEIGFKIHNRWDIEVVDVKTGKVKQRAQAENVITNNWWSVVASNGFPFYYGFFFGSGSGTPSVNDNALFHQEGYVSEFNQNQEDYCSYLDGISWTRRCHRFTELQQVGITFSELGLRSGSGSLVTHAMLTDMNGNPVSITKTDSDIFYIYATVYVHWNTRNNRFFNIYPYDSAKNIIVWAKGCSSLSVDNAKKIAVYRFNVYSDPLWSQSSYSPTITFDSANKKVTISYESTNFRIPVGGANAAGIGVISTYDKNVVFDVEDFYDGDDIVGEAIGTGDGSTTKFYTYFDLPENAKVYVNGVQKTSGVTVRRCCGRMEYPYRFVVGLNHTSTQNKKIHETSIAYTSDYYVYMRAESNQRGSFNGLVMENKNYVVGFKKIALRTIYRAADHTFYHSRLYGSNDLSNWTLLYTTTDYSPSSTSSDSYYHVDVTLNGDDGKYKYYKVEREGEFEYWNVSYHSGSSSWYEGQIVGFYTDSNATGHHIIFDEAPAEGDVITADYHTPLIAKDSDHVFDFGKFTISYGPYVE